MSVQGYIANNSVIQEPAQIQNQQTLNCQPGVILPASPCIQPSQQLVQQLPGGQFVQRQLSVGGGGGGVQTILASQQPVLSPSNSIGMASPYMCSA